MLERSANDATKRALGGPTETSSEHDDDDDETTTTTTTTTSTTTTPSPSGDPASDDGEGHDDDDARHPYLMFHPCTLTPSSWGQLAAARVVCSAIMADGGLSTQTEALTS